MQNKFFGFTNEVIQVNGHLMSKSVELSMDTAQLFIRNASEKTVGLLNVNSMDDYIQQQEKWNQKSIEQGQQLSRKVVEFGNEAYGAYLSLWQNYANTVQSPAADKQA